MAEKRPQGDSLSPLFAVLRMLAVLVTGLALGSGSARAQSQASQPKAKGKSKSAGAGAQTGGGGGATRLTVAGKSLHISCTRSLRDLARNRLECFGNVYIRRPNELLTSDYAVMELATEQLHAEGNVVYFTPDTVIYGTKMDFNFQSETGTITDGRVESDKYQLLGETIERRAVDHFVAVDGEYTTCRDCPASWKLAGKTIDLTVDGYAWLKQVFIKLNDAPTLYLPVMVVPVKTRRQSGLLFPQEMQLHGPNGFTFVLPYYWAISRSMDATIGLGLYSLRGPKGEAEYRYALGERSHGQFNGYYLRDRAFVRSPFYNRWAIDYTHNLQLPGGMETKLNYLDASDRDYARNIGDIPGRGEPALVSDAGISRPGRDYSIWANGKRIHNLITPQLVGWDANTVQLAPSVSVASVDHRVLPDANLYWGMSLNYSRFYRLGPTFDPIYPVDSPQVPNRNFFLPGITPIRRAQRFNLVPEMYYLANIGNVLEITPSVQYRGYSYLFDEGVVAPTSRGYLLAKTEVATSIERVYDGRVKHKFRPSLTYSNIPVVQQDNGHPFIKQIQTAGNEFDETDIVPVSYGTQLYFVPLGNSLAYELGNKFIYKDDAGVYTKVVDVTSGESIDFRQHAPGSTRLSLQALSRFYTLATVATQRMGARGEYYYYPAIRTATYNLSLGYTFARYMRRVLLFDRSINLSYSYNQVIANADSIGAGINWSLSDYFAFSFGIGYSFPTTQNNNTSPGVVQTISGGLTYQSPSQCYKLTLLASRTVDNPQLAINFNIPVNLTGEGYTDFQQGSGVLPNAAQSGPPPAH